MVDSTNKTTHFGFQTIPTSQKNDKVAEVFHSVSKQYDLMNDLMSFGLHRLWKRTAIALCQVRAGHRLLDLAGGTGDLTQRLSPLVGHKGQIILADINNAMLKMGRDRLMDHGILHNVSYLQADAEHLPLPDNYFDRIIMGFGLRNVANIDNVLHSIYRVLKPGGIFLILEFSHPTTAFIKSIYDAYSFNFIPRLGGWVVNDENSYRYLVESIRVHPEQATLKAMMTSAGFEDCHYHNLSAGIVAIHKGYKY